MEFLQIGESKLKIVASEDEMKMYKLENCSSGEGSAAIRRSFWKILDLAKAEVGFDPAGDKILVQFYPVQGGGCEIFVTKLGILPESSARMVSKSNRISMLSKNTGFYSFASLDYLVGAARAIKNIAGETNVASDVYYLNDVYYLSIEEHGKGGESTEFPCIIEFGEGLAVNFGVFILEHATKLTNGDGIEKFSAL